MEEIFAMVQRELIRSGVAEALASGLVLVGGSSCSRHPGVGRAGFQSAGAPGLPVNLKGMPEELDETNVCHRGGLAVDGAQQWPFGQRTAAALESDPLARH